MKAEGLPREAAERAAVGRYYFAVLLSTRHFIDTTHPPRVDRGPEAHIEVIRRLGKITDPDAVRLSAELQRLRISRGLMEYGDDVISTDLTLVEVQGRCKKAFVLLTSLESRHPVIPTTPIAPAPASPPRKPGQGRR